MPPALELSKVAEADFPSRFGHFRIYGFEGRVDGIVEESVVLKMGDIGGDPPLVRVHSQCFTGDVFHSLRCDCRAQLELALGTIASEGRGLPRAFSLLKGQQGPFQEFCRLSGSAPAGHVLKLIGGGTLLRW